MFKAEIIDEILNADLTYEELCDLTDKLLEIAKFMSKLPKGVPKRAEEITKMRLCSSLLLNVLYYKLTDYPVSLEFVSRLREAIRAMEVKDGG